MEKETHLGKLQEAMPTIVKGVVETAARLMAQVKKEFDGSSRTSQVEVAAALGIIAELARAGSIILREQGGVIFEDSQGPETQKVKLEERTGPKTFGELLRARVEETLPQKEQFKRRDLFGFLRNTGGTRKAIAGLNLAKERTSTRPEAILIVERTLTSSLRLEKETYTRSRLVSALLIGQDQLTEWSKLVGHDWGAHPTIDKSEALAIRGLMALEKLTKESSKS